MINAFGLWADMWSSWADTARSAGRMTTMANDSAYVIDHRTKLMADAMLSPLKGDYQELSKMVPEKVTAFSQAGLAGFQAMSAFQSETLAIWQKMAAIGMSGKPMSMAEGTALANRSANVMKRASRSSNRIMDPVTNEASANAKRLRKSAG